MLFLNRVHRGEYLPFKIFSRTRETLIKTKQLKIIKIVKEPRGWQSNTVEKLDKTILEFALILVK